MPALLRGCTPEATSVLERPRKRPRMARREQPKRHRVTILGTGVMGRRHVRVFSELHTRFDLVGVFDTSPGVGQEVAESAGVRCFAREAEAIAAAELVVVASPIAAHAPQVRRALGAGCNVLVEKPFWGAPRTRTARDEPGGRTAPLRGPLRTVQPGRRRSSRARGVEGRPRSRPAAHCASTHPLA